MILLDNTGWACPRGWSLCDALKLTEIDLLAYSLGGMVAQDLALLRPWLLRRLVLAGTGWAALGTVLALALGGRITDQVDVEARAAAGAAV